METSYEKLLRHFDEQMLAAREAGWWVMLDYREGGSCIYANYLGAPNRKYTEVACQVPHSLDVHTKWFADCASHLLRAGHDADKMIKAISRAERLLAEAAASH
jgi:hypothetical protein